MQQVEYHPEEILALMQNRRSTRQFESKPVPDEMVQKLLEAARWTQSACNYQPWRLIVIRNPQKLKAIAKLANYGHFIKDAPLAIAIVGDTKKSPKWYVYDTSMLAHQICLMAWSLGLGTCWIGSLDRDAAAKGLELNSHEFLTTILPIGFPKAGVTLSSTRKELKNMVTYLD